MTQKHERYLRERPQKIALKRLKRRRMLKVRNAESRMSLHHMRDVLADYIRSHPAPQPVRAGSPGVVTKIKNLFRKPQV